MKRKINLKVIGLVLLAACAGIFALFVHHMLFRPPEPRDDAYYFSNYAVQNYTFYTAGFFVVLGGLLAFWTRSNPFLIGFAMVLVFPVIAVIEGIVDPTSHNLIPFELATHAAFAVPAVAGAYLGNLIAGRIRSD